MKTFAYNKRFMVHNITASTTCLQIVCSEGKTVGVHLHSMTGHLPCLIAQGMATEVLHRIAHRIARTLHLFTVEKRWSKVSIL